MATDDTPELEPRGHTSAALLDVADSTSWRATCPVCGAACTEVIATAEDIQREIAARETFFRDRFASLARRQADVRDVILLSVCTAAPVMRCAACDVYVRGSAVGRGPDFEADSYDERTLETLRREHAVEFSRKAWVRSILAEQAKVLEVGSYVGGFLQIAKRWGVRVTGIDIGRDTSRFSRRLGDRAFRKSLDDFVAPAASFDAIFIWNCFEQLPDPLRALERCRELLVPAGRLVIRVPDAGLYAANRNQTAFVAYSNLLGFPHRFGFTQHSLEAICRTYGFHPEVLRHEAAMRPNRQAMAKWAQDEEAQLAPKAWIEAVFRRR